MNLSEIPLYVLDLETNERYLKSVLEPLSVVKSKVKPKWNLVGFCSSSNE